MMRAGNVGRWITRAFIRLIGITLMLVIGVIQAVGTIITAMSAVILKGISAVMIFVVASHDAVSHWLISPLLSPS